MKDQLNSLLFYCHPLISSPLSELFFLTHFLSLFIFCFFLSFSLSFFLSLLNSLITSLFIFSFLLSFSMKVGTTVLFLSFNHSCFYPLLLGSFMPFFFCPSHSSEKGRFQCASTFFDPKTRFGGNERNNLFYKVKSD